MTDAPLLRYAVTGTDTGIGKTIVTSALASRARELGLRVSAMKPIESGVESRFSASRAFGSDVERLHAATGGADPMEIMRPYALEEPLAPLIAAQRAGVTIDMTLLDTAKDTLSTNRDLLLIEGAGGLLVPISRDITFLDLFARWGCELIVVAGNRLGVLNHTLLTLRAAESMNVPVRAIILTSYRDDERSIAEATNYDALRMLLPDQAIYRFPWIDRSDDFEALAAAAAGCGLDALLQGGAQVAAAPQTLVLD
jgi:dethiobiotin synthetase